MRVSVSVKGSAITARLRWVREHHGEDAVKQLRAALAPDDRKVIEGRILPHEWVAFDVFVAVSLALDRIHGKGDLALCRELGRYAAQVNLPTLYRIFYMLGSPAFIVKRAARVWDVHYSSGRLDVDTTKEPDGWESARLRLVGFQTPHAAHCASVLGWCEESVRMSGGTQVTAEETRCRTRGDSLCEIVARWR